MKKKLISYLLITLMFMLTACGSDKADKDTSSITPNKLITVGFSQLGAESDWRSSNTQSMLQTFTKANGYNLIFVDGQQKQSNQIMAIRTFIQQGVDYIVLAPVTEKGWDTVLQEAKEAGIPVIIVDRQVDVEDDSLFVAWVGSDFELEGLKTAEFIHEYISAKGISDSKLNIVSLQGNIGATAQIGRTKGLEFTAQKYGWNILDMVPADFTQTKGKEVMTELINKYPELNVVYCENDNEALGAIEAIEEVGRTCGTDIENGEILVVSFDGINEKALSNVYDGKILCIAECNPHHGPRVATIISQIEAKITPEKESFVDEKIFTADETLNEITVEDKKYPVEHIQREEESVQNEN